MTPVVSSTTILGLNISSTPSTDPKIGGISAFFPAYNDGGTIASMVVSTLMTLRMLTDDYEVIVVNDGSADYTGPLLDELARIHAPHVRVVHHPRNRGYGAALRSGVRRRAQGLGFLHRRRRAVRPARTRACSWTPATRSGGAVEVVNGYKISRNDPWYRLLIGRIYHHLVKALFGFRLRDVDCDFRLIRRAVLGPDHPALGQRHDLPGTGEKTAGRRGAFRGGAGASFPPGVRAFAVF